MEKEFTLPIGLEIHGKLHRRGAMRPATAMDEIECQEEEKLKFNNRLRDISLLAKTITRIGDISPVTVEHIEEMYEADFIYLQLLCDSLNNSRHVNQGVRCPFCSKEHALDHFTLFAGGTA